MPLLRWLLPIVAALCVLGGSVASYAAAGWTGDTGCCCPVKTKCKCHDHDKQKPDQPTMKRCGGEARLVAPAPVTTTLLGRIEAVLRVQALAIAVPTPMKLSSAPLRAPEKPPF